MAFYLFSVNNILKFNEHICLTKRTKSQQPRYQVSTEI